MDKKYKKRKEYELKVSDRQLEQMSILHAMSVFSQNHKLKEIPDINPEWLEMWRKKGFWLHSGQVQDLKDKGIWDSGRIKIRKTKKGYVIEYTYNWRSKGIKSKIVVCSYCNKSELVNIMGICEKCEKKLKKKRKYQKYLWGNKDARRRLIRSWLRKGE